MNKKSLTEADIRTKFITPNIISAGWNIDTQVREEVRFTDGRIYVRGRIHTRGERKRADYILYYRPNIPIAIIEAKDNNHSVSSGIQQALGYAVTLDIPFVFSSNLLLLGRSPSDEDIVYEARENWHTSKLEIERERFFKALVWMREHGLIAAGRGRYVDAK